METYAYRIQPVRADMLAAGLDEREQAIVGEHFAYLQDALAFTEEDPAVRRGVMRAEVFPFHVALLNDNWG